MYICIYIYIYTHDGKRRDEHVASGMPAICCVTLYYIVNAAIVL